MAARTEALPGTARDLDGGRLLAGLGALVLLISLFLDWYGASESFAEADDAAGITAWTSFELIDILLAALALATLAWVIEGVASRSGRAVLPPWLASVAGPVAFVLVLVSILNEPPTLSVFDPTRELGIWLALAGAVLMTVGALLRIARISVVVAPRGGGAEGAVSPGPARTSDPAYPEAQTEPLSQDPGLPPPPR